jgi:hypothetical protein
MTVEEFIMNDNAHNSLSAAQFSCCENSGRQAQLLRVVFKVDVNQIRSHSLAVFALKTDSENENVPRIFASALVSS